MRKLVQGSGFKMVSPFKLDNQTETDIDKDFDVQQIEAVDLVLSLIHI